MACPAGEARASDFHPNVVSILYSNITILHLVIYSFTFIMANSSSCGDAAVGQSSASNNVPTCFRAGFDAHTMRLLGCNQETLERCYTKNYIVKSNALSTELSPTSLQLIPEARGI